MSKAKTPKLESIPPQISPQRAIELLKRQNLRAQELKGVSYNDPKVDAWKSTTENVLNQAFGKPGGLPHDNTKGFSNCSGGAIWIGMNDHDLQRNYLEKLNKRIALLDSYIEQLDDLSPPASTFAEYTHSFHSEIERVAGSLFRDGHYKQAALEAFILVINTVQKRSGLNLDGDPLMNAALSSSGDRRPKVQFNTFADRSERDEQQGLYFIFKGMVGLRNYKAHTNTLFSDRDRAYEYLALASLLLRLLERSLVNDDD